LVCWGWAGLGVDTVVLAGFWRVLIWWFGAAAGVGFWVKRAEGMGEIEGIGVLRLAALA
jgi:hypothetical protein